MSDPFGVRIDGNPFGYTQHERATDKQRELLGRMEAERGLRPQFWQAANVAILEAALPILARRRDSKAAASVLISFWKSATEAQKLEAECAGVARLQPGAA